MSIGDTQILTFSLSNSAGKKWIQRWTTSIPFFCGWRNGRLQHETQTYEAWLKSSGKCNRKIVAGKFLKN